MPCFNSGHILMKVNISRRQNAIRMSPMMQDQIKSLLRMKSIRKYTKMMSAARNKIPSMAMSNIAVIFISISPKNVYIFFAKRLNLELFITYLIASLASRSNEPPHASPLLQSSSSQNSSSHISLDVLLTWEIFQ